MIFLPSQLLEDITDEDLVQIFLFLLSGRISSVIFTSCYSLEDITDEVLVEIEFSHLLNFCLIFLSLVDPQLLERFLNWHCS